MLTRRNWFKAAVATAFATGAATINAKEKTNTSRDNDKYKYDVVVVGAGPAGLAAAIEAHDLGLRSIVLEKMDSPAGNSLYATGGIATYGTKFQEEAGFPEDRESFEADMMKVSQYKADPKLVKAYCDNIVDAVNWLHDDIGVQFGKLRGLAWPLNHRMLLVDGKGLTGGSQLVRTLLAAAKKRDIPVVYNTKVVELLTNEKGRVDGVRTLGDDGYQNYYAQDGVVIASGGFSANREMLNTYMGGPLSRIVLRGSPYVTGENVSLTKPLGAMLVHMDQFHCGPIVEDTHANPNNVISSGLGIDIDVRGKRIMDEAYTYTQKSIAAVTKTPENKAYHIMDSQWERMAPEAKKFQSLNSEVHIADTPEGLAKGLGLEPKVLTDLIAEYNERVKNGTLKDWDPPCTLPNAKPLEKPPYYAIPFQGGITATFGGPKINANAQVINNEEKPIKGLYAAGNAAGGLFYDNYIGGCQLGGATVFGRQAARHMAKHHKTN